MKIPRVVHVLSVVIVLVAGELPGTALAGDGALPSDAVRGGLWLRGAGEEAYGSAPTLHTYVDMTVTGMLARVRVRQRFHNPGARWAEGIYVFPLPEHAAVDHLRMCIGERVIEGQIEERQQARTAYEQARRSGRRASLVEQERPNIFTSSLANIAPGEDITVEIAYQQTVRHVDGVFRLRFPMVVAPRYIPGRPLALEDRIGSFAGGGRAMATDQVPDAGRIGPPVARPGAGPLNPVSLAIHLNAGMALASVTSPYHGILDQEQADGVHQIRLAEGTVAAERDFELVWRPLVGGEPRAAWFVQQAQDGQYGLLMLVPSQGPAPEPVTARELVFVIDTSGSMHGESMEQARGALLLALGRLRRRDRFNLIRFNDHTEGLFPRAQTATPGHIAAARRYVRALEAEGGTEMAPALQLALQRGAGQGGLRQVIFLTDGSVGNEQALFRLIRECLGDSRLFTVGIGSAPNSYFMRKAARFGRGSFTYVGDTGEVEETMSALVERLERPALTHIQLELPPQLRLERLPRRIPDLYAGEPLMLAFHGRAMPSQVVVHGLLGQRPWHTRVTLTGGGQDATLAPEWGRRRIEMLMAELHGSGSADARETLRGEVVDTALRHHLVSRYTSLVAVDVTPARVRGQSLDSHAMVTRLPQGWSYDHVFGLSQTDTPASLQILTGMLLLLGALGYGLLRRRACAA
jgi:Ca-activated chloride channel family protein